MNRIQNVKIAIYIWENFDTIAKLLHGGSENIRKKNDMMQFN